MNNQSLLKILTSAINTKPDIIQFAKDRRYEESWIIPESQPRPSDNEINSYLSKEPFKLLIVEYIWNSQNDDNRFVLTLFLDGKCKLKDPKQFITISLNNFFQYTNFSSFIINLDSDVIGKTYLFQKPAEAVNMGIFNHWLSIGPVDIWNKGEKYNTQTTKAAIHARPDIEYSKLNYQGLLFRYNVTGLLDGTYYGLKTPCCNKVGSSWIVDYQKVDHWMKLLLQSTT